MISINRKNPTAGEITSSLTNASDAAGLHFADGGYIDGLNSAGAEFGTSDFSIEFILNQTEDNTVDNYIYFTHTSGDSRLYVRNDISENLLRITWVNSGGVGQARDIAYDMSADYGTPTHYVLIFDRDGDATLYKNGNSVGSIDISAESSIDLGAANTAPSRFGSSATYGVIGTFYRLRTWNKALSSTEVTATYENATVPFADQYGSQTEKVTNGDFASDTAWTKQTGWTIGSGVASSTGSNNGAYLYQGVGGLTGKRYRISVEITVATSGSITPLSSSWSASNLSTVGVHTFDQIWLGTDPTLHFRSNSFNGSLDNVSVVEIGCVADYDLAFANPTQSTMVQDRAGAADGTTSASGVTQVTPIEQLNSKSARIGTSAATPAEGELLVSGNVGVGGAPVSAAGVARFLYVGHSDHAGVVLDDTDATPWEIYNIGGALYFSHNGTTSPLTIDSAGLCSFSNGIAFQSATTSPGGTSSEVFTLSAYERGTFTPTIEGGVNPTQSYSIQQGWYEKIGRTVHVSGYVGLAATGVTAGTGSAYLGGLPFTGANETYYSSAMNVGYVGGWGTATSGAPTYGYFISNSTQCALRTYNNDAGKLAADMATSAADAGNAAQFIFSGTYKTKES